MIGTPLSTLHLFTQKTSSTRYNRPVGQGKVNEASWITVGSIAGHASSSSTHVPGKVTGVYVTGVFGTAYKVASASSTRSSNNPATGSPGPRAVAVAGTGMGADDSKGLNSALAALADRLRAYHAPGTCGFDCRGGSVASGVGGGREVVVVGPVKSPGPDKAAHCQRKKFAAVLICLFQDQDNRLRVILTKRSHRLSSHPGEVALPGGKLDEEDVDLKATALREAQEEIGLPPSSVHVVARLGSFLSKHLLSVTPVVALLPDPDSFRPLLNEAEVADIFDAPLDMFLADRNHRTSLIEWLNVPYMVHHFDYRTGDRDFEIWGLTAAILIRAASVVYGRQPDFPEFCSLVKQVETEPEPEPAIN